MCLSTRGLILRHGRFALLQWLHDYHHSSQWNKLRLYGPWIQRMREPFRLALPSMHWATGLSTSVSRGLGHCACSVTRTITVQQTAVPEGYPDTPLPTTGPLTFPINVENREWITIAGPGYSHTTTPLRVLGTRTLRLRRLATYYGIFRHMPVSEAT